MTFCPTKGGKLCYVITHVILANQKTESTVYWWISTLAMFDATCFPAFVRASGIISSVLLIRLFLTSAILFPVRTRLFWRLLFDSLSGHVYFDVCYLFPLRSIRRHFKCSVDTFILTSAILSPVRSIGRHFKRSVDTFILTSAIWFPVRTRLFWHLLFIPSQEHQTSFQVFCWYVYFDVCCFIPGQDTEVVEEEITVNIHRQPGMGLGISIAGGKGSTPFKGVDEVWVKLFYFAL